MILGVYMTDKDPITTWADIKPVRVKSPEQTAVDELFRKHVEMTDLYLLGGCAIEDVKAALEEYVAAEMALIEKQNVQEPQGYSPTGAYAVQEGE